jgi:hypothetical protein
MRKLFITLAAATAAMSLATPAVAIPTVNPDVSGTPDSYQIFGIKSTGNPVYGSSPNNTNIPNVRFDANAVTNMDITDGFAQITDAGSTPLWTQLIINPDLNFTDMKFAISLTGGTGSVLVYYLLAGGPTSDGNYPINYTQCLTCTITADGSDKNFELSGASFNGVMFQVVGQGLTFNRFKQMSYEPTGGVRAVPEPATWALMLLGFGGMGMALRRSRRRGKRTLMQIA